MATFFQGQQPVGPNSLGWQERQAQNAAALALQQQLLRQAFGGFSLPPSAGPSPIPAAVQGDVDLMGQQAAAAFAPVVSALSNIRLPASAPPSAFPARQQAEVDRMIASATAASRAVAPVAATVSQVFNPDQPLTQGDKETQASWLLRRGGKALLSAPFSAVRGIGEAYNDYVGNPFANFIMSLAETPNDRKAAGHRELSRGFSQSYNRGRGSVPQARSTPDFTSYKSPVYDSLEQQVVEQLGNPQLAPILRAIRTTGERSNADQVSSAGARTVYQFTPETRQLFIKKHGIDPWSNPQNAALAAGIHIQESLARNNGNPVAAIGEYIGGPNRSNWGDTTQAYIQRTASALGELPGMMFDPSYYQQALGEIDKAAAFAAQPQTVQFDLPPAPEMPDPILPAKTDFTKADAALEALRPQAPTETQRKMTMRANVWQAIGQGLAQTPDGAGLGKVLAMVGGAALAGRGRGMEEWQDRLDRYEQKLQQFQTLVFQNETQKAQTVAAEARQEAATLNEFGLKKWASAMQQWSKFNDVQATAGGFITSTLKDGKVTSTFIPNRGAVMADAAMKRAGILGNMAGDYNNTLDRAYGNLPGLVTGLAAQEWMMDRTAQADPEISGGMAASAGIYAADVISNGYLPSVIGEEAAADLAKRGQLYLRQLNPALMGSPEKYQEELNNWMVGQLTELMMKEAITNGADSDLWQKFGSYGQLGRSIREQRARATAKTSERTDYRGRTTRTETYGGE